MKKQKAVIIGGSNGIGLAVAKEFIRKNYYVEILDIVQPDDSISEYENGYSYTYCDLYDFDEEMFEILADDSEVTAVMITAGFGRVTDFENIHISEIEKLISVNETAVIKVIRIFYERIRAEEKFLCGVMGSIAGLVSSPMFSVYAASKAALCRFTESVNIELELCNTDNRILNVSPGSIKGTKFNGGDENFPELTEKLASQITVELEKRSTLFIPQYEEIYKDVLERYHSAPHSYGLSSYEYKQKSGRVSDGKKAVIGYLSGTFDLFHIGHLNIIRNAKKQCDYLIVGVHKDASHKGKETVISFEERVQIISAVKYVDKVVMSCAEDSDAWDMYHYNRLFVGSDYKGTERFRRYEEYFSDKNVDIVYFPYTNEISSTDIRRKINK